MDKITELANEKATLRQMIKQHESRIREIDLEIIVLKFGITLNETKVIDDKGRVFLVTGATLDTWREYPKLHGRRILKSGEIGANWVEIWHEWKVMTE